MAGENDGEQGSGDSTPEPVESSPLLQVVSPDATPEEIAALVTVFASMGAPAASAPTRTPEWQAHHRKVRATYPHGPGGWRSSGLPR
jgi:hypothetical protein